MRSYEDLLKAALTLRNRLLEEGKDPTDTVFTLTHAELDLLNMRTWQCVEMDHPNGRFCGFRLQAI